MYMPKRPAEPASSGRTTLRRDCPASDPTPRPCPPSPASARPRFPARPSRRAPSALRADRRSRARRRAGSSCRRRTRAPRGRRARRGTSRSRDVRGGVSDARDRPSCPAAAHRPSSNSRYEPISSHLTPRPGARRTALRSFLEPLERRDLTQRVFLVVLCDMNERDAVGELERRVPKAVGLRSASSSYTARTSSSFSSTWSGLTL